MRSDFRDILATNKEACAEIMLGKERSMILRFPKTRLLLIGQVEPTELQEGIYLQTPCKPKPKGLSALCEYDYLYIHLLTLFVLIALHLVLFFGFEILYPDLGNIHR